MLTGSHVSSAGGPLAALERAKELGCEVYQVFLEGPQQWPRHKVFVPEKLAAFQEALSESYIDSFYIHAPYLINLASADPMLLMRSVDALVGTLRQGALLGARAVVLHPGSRLTQSWEQVLPGLASTLRTVIDQAGADAPYLLLENCAGQGSAVGSFVELAQIVERVSSEKLGVCLDIQHAHAHAFDLSGEEGRSALVQALEETGLGAKLRLVHANDSKVAPLSRKDRHADIGTGSIGPKGVLALSQSKFLADIPWVLETPSCQDEAELLRFRAILAGKTEVTGQLF